MRRSVEVGAGGLVVVLVVWLIRQLLADQQRATSEMLAACSEAVAESARAVGQVFAPVAGGVVDNPANDLPIIPDGNWVVPDPTDGWIEDPPDSRVAWGRPPVLEEMGPEHEPWLS